MRKESFESRKFNLAVSGVRNVVLAIILITIFSLISGSVYSQPLTARPEQGSGSNGGYQTTNIDSISLQNGAVSVSVPLASLPPIAGGKLGYTLTATYSGKLWSMHQSEARPPNYAPNCPSNYSTQAMWDAEGSGWTVGGEYQIFYRAAREGFDYIEPDLQSCYGYEWYAIHGYSFFKPMLRMPDGSEHELRFQTYVPVFNGQTPHLSGYYVWPAGGFTSTVRMHTIDGTFITVEKNPPNSSVDSTIYFKDGTRIETSSAGQKTIDPNGNSILMGYVSGPNGYRFIRDDLGRQIKMSFTSYNGQDAWKVEYQAVGGEWKAAYVVWGSTTVTGKVYGKTAWNENGGEFGQGDICYVNENLLPTQLGVIREIILPATESGTPPQRFTFGYNSDTTVNTSDDVMRWCGMGAKPETYERDASIGWGEISSVETPTGAKITYTYSHDGIHTFSQGSQYDGNEVLKNVITQKTLEHDGQTDTWTYSISSGIPMSYSGGSVINPDGSSYSETYNPTDIAYSGRGGDDGMGSLVVRSEQSGMVRTEKKWTALGGFISSIGDPTDFVGINRMVDTEFTTLMDGQGNRLKMSAKKYLYDFNGDITQTTEYDWFDPASVTYTNNNPVWGYPTAVPAGAVVLRVTNTAYYNQATGPAAPTAYQNRDVSPTGRVMLGHPQATSISDGTTVKSTSQFSYDGNSYGVVPNKGNVTKVSTWDDATSTWIDTLRGYDSYGNVTSKTDANGNVTNIYYGDSTHALPTSTVVDPENGTGTQTTSATFDYYTGLPLTATDVNNITSTISYTNHRLGAVDPFGRPGTTYSPTINIDGVNQKRTVKNFYEDQNRITRTETDLFSEGDGKSKTWETHDQLGRVVLSQKNENGGNTPSISSYTVYGDTANRVVLTSNPMRAVAATTDGWTRTTTDILGRNIETATFSGTSQPPLTLTNANWTGSVTTSYSVNTSTDTDQAGKVRRSVVNALGQLTRVDEPNISGQLDVSGNPVQPTHYTYDVLGNLITVTQSDGTATQTRSFTYSSLSRLITATNPESGTTPTNGTTYFEYDANGNMTEKTDPRNITTTYSYDALNRITNRDYTGSTPDVTYTYENGSIANSKGKLTKVVTGSVSNPLSVTEYLSFDVFGRVTRSKQTTDGDVYGTDDKPMTYTYNLSGALTQQTYPSGRVVRNALDSGGDLAAVQSKKTAAAGYWNYADSFTYNSAGAIISMQMGNGRWASTQFNNRLQPTRIALGKTQNATDVLKLDYIYGTWEGSTLNSQKNNGNLAQQEITVPTVGSNPGFHAMQLYAFDTLNRIAQATELIAGAQSWQQTMSYDRFGNRSFNESATTTIPKNCSGAVCAADRKLLNPSVSASSNRLTTDQDGDSVADYTFDNAGNTTKMADGKTFVYDGENKQTEVWNGSLRRGEYFYDGDGKRVKKMAYDQYGVLIEKTIFVYDASGRLVGEYSTALNPTPQVSYLTHDHLGSQRINTNENGAVISRRDFHPFGEEITGGPRTASLGYIADDNRKQFTSYERDDETGLDFAQERMYASKLGRFTTTDPTLLSVSADNPQSWNRYVYVMNNPVVYTDPLGLWRIDWRPIYKRNKDGEVEKDENGQPIVTGYEVIVIKDSKEDTPERLAQQLGLTGNAARDFAANLGTGTEIRLSTTSDRGIRSLFEKIEERLTEQAEWRREHFKELAKLAAEGKYGPSHSDCSRTVNDIARLGNTNIRVGADALDRIISEVAKSVASGDAQSRDIVRYAKEDNKATHWANFIFRMNDGKPVVFSKSGEHGAYEIKTTRALQVPMYGTVRGKNEGETGFYRKK